MSSIEESNENSHYAVKKISEKDNINNIDKIKLENGFISPNKEVKNPKKVNRSISESVQYTNIDYCDTTNEIPKNLQIRLQTSGQGMPNEVDCVCEAVGKDSSSVQYSCEYQLSSGSPKPDNRSKTRRIGMDLTDDATVMLKEEPDTGDCIPGTKRMTIENLPAARIQGKFSLNIPYE